jgi:hypothetical protein
MVQHRAAHVAITASATRGQGASGVVECARDFAVALRLSRFGTSDEHAFERQLDAATDSLRLCLPNAAASWGLARKLLNIFLRDSFYTSYLAKAHGLSAAERLFEIPLDKITAKQIRKARPEVPRWPGVKYLDPAESTAYQAAALEIAKRHRMARVHLDAYWWGAGVTIRTCSGCPTSRTGLVRSTGWATFSAIDRSFDLQRGIAPDVAPV